MIDTWLKGKLAAPLKDMLPLLLPPFVEEVLYEKLARIVQLDPDRQYIVFVKRDEDAQAMIEGVSRYMDQSRMPRLVVLAAKEEPKFLEIGPKRS